MAPPNDDMPTIAPALPCKVSVGPQVDSESWRLIVPAKPATYLLQDADARPVLLATAGNLRNVLLHRLGPPDPSAPSRRTDYRSITRTVAWRPAYSAFEANWALLENARTLMPDRYRRMIRHWHGWWLHANPDGPFPQFKVHRDLTARPGQWLGPMPTAAAGKRVIDLLIDLLDLCRYHEILTKAPDGQACAYKEMGRCPAPCDGTVSMDHYRQQMRLAIDLLSGGLESWREQATLRMKQAAAERAFEQAQKLKDDLHKARGLSHPELACARPIQAMNYLVVQRGRRRGQPRLFAVSPGRISLLGELVRRDREAQLDWAAQQASAFFESAMPPLNRESIERIGLVSWHQLRGEREKGRWIRVTDTEAEALRRLIEVTVHSSN